MEFAEIEIEEFDSKKPKNFDFNDQLKSFNDNVQILNLSVSALYRPCNIYSN